VLSDEDRLTLAALGLDSLSDAVPDDAILHLLSNLDAAADVRLLHQTGQQVLAWLLAGPEARGQQLGGFLDVLINPARLERSVARNDEVGVLLCGGGACRSTSLRMSTKGHARVLATAALRARLIAAASWLPTASMYR
jgi:hypothetical protein